MMSLKLLLMFKGISLLSILTGFIFQSWEVSREYFGYRTNTLVAIQHYPEVIKAPAMVFCYLFHTLENVTTKSAADLFTGEENYFNDKNDTWKIVMMRARLPVKEKPKYLIKKF